MNLIRNYAGCDACIIKMGSSQSCKQRLAITGETFDNADSKDDYRFARVIGSGGFGQVWHVIHKRSGG